MGPLLLLDTPHHGPGVWAGRGSTGVHRPLRHGLRPLGRGSWKQSPATCGGRMGESALNWLPILKPRRHPCSPLWFA